MEEKTLSEVTSEQKSEDIYTFTSFTKSETGRYILTTLLISPHEQKQVSAPHPWAQNQATQEEI